VKRGTLNHEAFDKQFKKNDSVKLGTRTGEHHNDWTGAEELIPLLSISPLPTSFEIFGPVFSPYASITLVPSGF
jgi:hypothetical protein